MYHRPSHAPSPAAQLDATMHSWRTRARFGFRQIRWSEARANLMKALIVPSKDTPYGPLQTRPYKPHKHGSNRKSIISIQTHICNHYRRYKHLQCERYI